MSKVKLDLKNRNDNDLRVFATEHKEALVGNASFGTPAPTPAVFDASLTAYTTKLDAIAATEAALEAMRAEKEVLRATLEANLILRGSYVELTSGGDEATIQSAGFEVRATAAVTSALAAPQNVVASTGLKAGQIVVSCATVYRAKSYVIELREHSATAAPGAWRKGKVTVRSTATLVGLVSGCKYAVRVRALGARDIQSPWSAETAAMAP